MTEQLFTISTDAGNVAVTPQNGRTLYVRAAVSDTGLPADTVAPLDLGHGVTATFRGHFKRDNDGEWTCKQPFMSRTGHKRDRPITPKQRDRAVNSIREALAAWAVAPRGRTALQAAQLEASTDAAQTRVAAARELRAVADHLEAEARELVAGGRVTYRQVAFRDRGAPEHVTQVERRDGTLMDPPMEPPAIYGARKWAWKNIKTNEETD